MWVGARVGNFPRSRSSLSLSLLSGRDGNAANVDSNALMLMLRASPSHVVRGGAMEIRYESETI